MLFSVLNMTSSVIQRRFHFQMNVSVAHLLSFRMKLFVRGSGARYEGPRNLESLEAFYRQKISEDENVCSSDRSP